MFDETQNKEPEDIFSGSDPTAVGSKPVMPTQPGQISSVVPLGVSNNPVESESTGSNKKVVVVAIVVVILILLLVAILVGLWITRSGQDSVDVSQPSNVVDNLPIQPVLTTELPNIETPSDAMATIPVDTDGDGLTDEEELLLGTSSILSDTDDDGLSDKDEVRVWNSNPLNSDTDGDGFKDGAEVDGGYDPNQAGGVLLDVGNIIQ